ncbi:hypothetical protein [Actinoplanes utahensis]|uniref:Uncharacterized protein n=1 Tax=Actinoplanes utahensis TaxID=1869 RepID=A0A0A6UR10_ACTUT|nr:hypothetical protein [Actinoplanes utahensis]KHD77851.1 hypothetical protein MB27_08670 [Actinoplanes utahensis]
MIAATALLGAALLTACDSGDPPVLDSTLNTGTAAPSPIVATGAPGKWQKLAGECPQIPAAAGVLQPGKTSRGTIENSIVLNVQCEYAAIKGKLPKASVNIGIYRIATIEGPADQLAVANLAKNRRVADTDPTVPVRTLRGIGDAGFASVFPGKGVRLYAQSSNAVVLLEYADPGDGERSLARAEAYTRDVLAALQ